MSESNKRRWFSPVLRLKARRLSDELLPHLPAAGRILDFGCGDGVLTDRLARGLPRAEVVGLDVVDTSLTDRTPVLYSGGRIPFSDASFDAAVAVFALHHCADERAALAELRRVTRGPLLVVEEICDSRAKFLLTAAHDWLVNRIESAEVALPLNFHSDRGWRRIFFEHRYRLASNARRVRQMPALNLTTQTLYVLAPISSPSGRSSAGRRP